MQLIRRLLDPYAEAGVMFAALTCATDYQGDLFAMWLNRWTTSL